MTDNTWLEKLSPDLFWDVDRATVDAVKNRRWLVERVLSRGRLEDWRIVSEHLDKATLRELLPVLKIAPRERHYLELFTGSIHA